MNTQWGTWTQVVKLYHEISNQLEVSSYGPMSIFQRLSQADLKNDEDTTNA